MKATLQALEDWKTIVGKACGVIVDAMTFRTAEMFVLGAKEAVQESQIGDEDAIWKAISQNIGALQTFIDTVVLRRRLPMIAYWATFFDPDTPATPATVKLLDRCNQKEDVLLPVELGPNAYLPLKAAAIETLNRERPVLTDQLRTLVYPELSAFDYQWKPRLDDLKGFEQSSEEDKRLLTFLFGRVLFSAYAQAAKADEVLQPKLARLHVLSSLRRNEDRDQMQAKVFAGLKEIARGGKEDIADLVDVPWMPTFLPYLLSKDPASPQELLEQALALRKESSVKDYVSWFAEIEKDLDYSREPMAAHMVELEKIRQAIAKRLEVPDEDPTTVKATIASVKLGVTIEQKVPVSRIWGWVTDLFPKHRYRKLLLEIVDAERRYSKLDTQLEVLWRGAAG
ncbi:MAG: hypothetical protein JSW39_10800 [Desulfobacterales bacterium]|nr:MAG: hypothetical protein JSW39_10800 [Desulfobacterales bacterium]